MSSQHYRRIVSHLRAAIDSGQLQTGDELPSEAELCEQFGSSRGPVRQAMGLLRTEGMISTGRGRRSTVLARSSGGCFDASLSLTNWLRDVGRTPRQRVLRLVREPADPETAAALRLPAGEHIITLERLRLADGRPVAIERAHFPMSIGEHVLAINPDTDSVFAHLAEKRLIVDHLARRISAITADEEQARLLEVSVGTALLQVVLTAADEHATPLAHAVHLFPGADVSLDLNTVRGTPFAACLTPLG